MTKNAATVRDAQTDALWEAQRERDELWTKIREAVRPGHGEYLTEVISLPSGGHVVGVYHGRRGTLPAGTYWTTVVGGRSDHTYYPSDTLAVLALLSRKVEDDPNLTRHVVRHAARLIGLPRSEDA